MIARERIALWEVLLAVRGSVVPRIAPQIISVALLSALVVWAQQRDWIAFTPVAPVALTTIGGALSIFAAFRNAACYDRWWEGRRLLGSIAIEARSLARLARRHIAVEVHDDVAWRIAARCIAFGYLARDLLRGDLPGDAGLQLLPEEERALIRAAGSPPYGVLDAMSRDLADVAAANRVASSMLFAMEERVGGLCAALAGLERIRATPVPFAYTLLLHRTAYLFCFFLMPFGLAYSVGWWTPLLTALIAYTFFGLDAMGQELGAPFMLSSNCLPLDAIARAIDIGVRESMGATVLPAAPTPNRHFLS
ncbi:MAG: bestrophin family protein [Proteobacteria bacterium]|nr:bestrophin family protein [Pseudomonadota bacterium]